MRAHSRDNFGLRPVELRVGGNKFAEGTCLVEFGDTRVLTTCSVEERVPPHVMGTGAGWVTAEYGMLPRATKNRTRREAAAGKQGGRTLEIQRLIGRSLRAAIDLKGLGPRTLTVDCDVLQADGGTRTAAITGGFVAMVLALRTLKSRGTLAKVPTVTPVSAISVGMVGGEVLVDLDYPEDSSAQVDLNVIGMPDGKLVEVQGTAERHAFSRADLAAMLDAAETALLQLFAKQAEALE